jgi:glycosyltransferase involved in cell wall biosynthesis
VSPIKVVFVIPSLDSGGIENYLLRFLQFAKSEVTPIVVVRNYNKGVLYDAYLELCSEVYFAPIGVLNPKKKRQFYKLLCSFEATHVVDFNANFAGWTMLLARLARYKNRITFYRQGKDHFKKSIFKTFYNAFLNQLVYTFSTQILSNSNSALLFFFPNRFKEAKFRVIYNGIDFKKFRQEPDKVAVRNQLNLPLNNFIIGHSGRLDPMKNHELIIKLASACQTVHPEVLFVLVGEGTEKIHALSKNIISLGYKNNVNQYLSAFDAFIFPSFSEGQPNAMIEAMASGLPILASNIPSIKECIPVEQHDLLLDPSDLDAFNNSLKKLISNPTIYKIDSQYVVHHFDGAVNFRNFLNTLH